MLLGPVFPSSDGWSIGKITFTFPTLASPIYSCVRTLRRAEEGLSTQLSLLAGELTSEEMDHLTQVASAPESMANSRQSLADYIAVIRAEAIKRSGASENDLLLAAQRSNLEKKAYMEEKP